MKRAYIWVLLAAIIAVCGGCLFWLSANYSEEFTWGVSISVDSQKDAEALQSDLKNFLSSKDYGKTNVHVNVNENETQIKINADLENDEVVAQLSSNISEMLISKKYIESTEDIIWQTLTGPSVGSYMKSTAFQALIIWIILMVIYMLLAFQSIRTYISPAVLSWVVVCVILFDILATLGVFWFWMLINETIQVDTVFIVSVLTVIAYWINDVIVIFDRIRENLSKNKEKNVIYGKVFDNSIWQSMRRSIWTSISTLIVLVAMFVLWNSAVLQQFSLSVGSGIIISTLSSLFLWAPLAYLMMGKFQKESWSY